MNRVLQTPDNDRPTRLLYIALGSVLLLGMLLRLLYLDRYPAALNQDELSNIYDAYSITETGADRWGQPYPLILRGFGASDFRPPLYAWLSALSIQLFGFSVSAGRLVSAVLGCVSLVLVHRVASRLGGHLLGFFALLLASLSPWHIVFSRLASEGTMLPAFFLILVCYGWQKAWDRHYSLSSLALLGLVVGLGTNTYQASKLIFFLFALLILASIYEQRRQFWGRAFSFGVGCLLGAGPQLLVALWQPEHFFSRANGSLTKFTSVWQYGRDLLFHLWVNVSPKFLFFQFGRHNNLSIGRLLAVEFLPFYLGLIVLWKVLDSRQVIKPLHVYLLLFIAILPASLTVDNPHALRASGLVVLAPIVTAAGLSYCYRKLNERYRKFFLAGCVFLIVGNSGYCLQRYLRSEQMQNEGMHAMLTTSAQKLGQYQQGYSKVFVERLDDRQHYLFVAAYTGMTPAAFMRADKKLDTLVWDQFRQLGKFYFLTRPEIEAKVAAEPAKTLLMLRAKDSRYRLLDSTEVNQEKVFLYDKTDDKR